MPIKKAVLTKQGLVRGGFARTRAQGWQHIDFILNA